MFNMDVQEIIYLLYTDVLLLLFQNLEAELSKKCDELRQLFLLQQSQQQQHASEDTNSTATPSPPTSTTSVLRALRKPSGEYPEEH